MRVITGLQKDNTIVIKKADKGAMVVVMNRSDYLAEALSDRHLGNAHVYRRCSESPETVLASVLGATTAFVSHLYV